MSPVSYMINVHSNLLWGLCIYYNNTVDVVVCIYYNNTVDVVVFIP